MNYALTVYPLSTGFRARLADALASEPVYLNLSQLRSLPLPDLWRQLRSLRGSRLVLALEDESSRCILPLLRAIAAVTNADAVEIRDAELRSQPVARAELASALTALASASIGSRIDAARCGRRLRRLARAPRVAATVGRGRALYVNANLWFGLKAGGSVGHVAGVINGLGDAGLDVSYAAVARGPMIRPEVPLVPLAPPAVFGLPYELAYYTFHRMVVDALRRLAPPAFIYQRLSIGNFTGVELSRQWQVPLVLEYNGSEAWIARHWGRPLRYHDLAARAEAVSLQHAHLVVTVSEALRDELIDKGVSADRIVCYPNGIDPSVFDPARFSEDDRLGLRSRHGIPPDAVVATFVGTFGQWHGAEVLAQAIRRLVDEDREWLTQSRVHFLLVGDGLKMPAVREILAGDACQRFVTLTGLVPQADAPGYLAASDVLLSPHVANADGSRFFGSPTKLFEYMAMGKAIVASDLDQIGDVLRPAIRSTTLPAQEPSDTAAEIAVLFPPGDVASLAASFKFTVERGAWRATLGRNARSEALRKYTWRHHVGAILDRLRPAESHV